MFISKVENIKNTIPIKYHFIFWVAYFTFNVVRWGSYFNDYWYSLKSNLVDFPLNIIIVYINIYYLVPQFALRKKYRSYVFFLILSLAIHYLVRSGLIYLLVIENIWPEAEGVQEAFGFNHVVAVTLGELYIIGLVSAIKFTIDFIRERNKNDQLLKLQYETELNYLKAQIQPHFFFNTLNNLYALTIQKSKKAPGVVLKLSEIMQYVIYDVSKKKIPLLKEVNYIQNYIELEKMRHEDLVESDILITGDVDDVEVPPLLFLPFIENCFKHGLKDGKKIFLKIHFKKQGNRLHFKLKNNFSPVHITNTKKGIGIINTKRRLELLYDNEFKLKARPVENQYKVILKIPLK